MPTCVRYGTRTYRVSRTTDGVGRLARALWRTPSPSATQTALLDRIRIVARLTETTHRGSYVALSTNAVLALVRRMSGIAPSS
jgi:hypothetical protein